MADLEKIAEDLSALTVIEAAELSKMLEEKWGVSAAAPVAVAAAAPGADAGGVLADLYRVMRDPGSGRVDNVLKIHSLHPDGLKAHFSLYRAAMEGTRGLSKAEREMIALVVSKTNGCHY